MKDKYMGTIKVGSKGQVVIPKEVRDMFHIDPGETLLLLADVKQGIAIVKNDAYLDFAREVFNAQEKPEEPEGN
ncbi:MAG: hypothetical protein DELT_03037 [Desulfovibrio sp.]|uniref:AbrB/MazE/SpoVT family DNA-binding domain-containing protein n=1 Tax=Christensenella intestinihominis TaxID=1851429 RepID=UPI00082A46A6|nr:AbrB/MazE/SpoVT family DNA-binding domain-containing protein [Christensenella intestinihominis]